MNGPFNKEGLILSYLWDAVQRLFQANQLKLKVVHDKKPIFQFQKMDELQNRLKNSKHAWKALKMSHVCMYYCDIDIILGFHEALAWMEDAYKKVGVFKENICILQDRLCEMIDLVYCMVESGHTRVEHGRVETPDVFCYRCLHTDYKTVKHLHSVLRKHAKSDGFIEPLFWREMVYLCSSKKQKVIPDDDILIQMIESIISDISGESSLMPEDEWYPDQPLPSIKEEKTEEPIQVIQVLPNNEKLVKVTDRKGKIKYIVIGEDVDIKRLPKIYALIREDLKMGRNVTTDRLTRILKLDELLSQGHSKKECAAMMDVSMYIIWNDLRVLKEINKLNQELDLAI